MFIAEAYKATIINQQVSAFVMQEEYNASCNSLLYGDSFNFLNEAEDSKLKQAGNWIKEKVGQFVKMIKTWLGKLKILVTKTIPGWISKKWNQLLVFLKIKKKPVEVNVKSAPPAVQKKVKAAAAKANKAVSMAVLAKMEDDGFDDSLKDNGSFKSVGAQAAKYKSEAIKALQAEMASDPEYKQYYAAILKAIQANHTVYVNIAENKGSIKVKTFPLSVIGDILDPYLDAFSAVDKAATLALKGAMILNSAKNAGTDVGEDIKKDAYDNEDEIKSITWDTLAKQFNIMSSEQLQSKKQEVEVDSKILNEYIKIKTLMEKTQKDMANKFGTIEKTLNNALTILERCAKPGVSVDQKVVSNTMTATKAVLQAFNTGTNNFMGSIKTIMSDVTSVLQLV